MLRIINSLNSKSDIVNGIKNNNSECFDNNIKYGLIWYYILKNMLKNI